MRVHFQVIEGARTRTQVFEGVVIKRQGSGARETFTVRKQSFGVGVERTFPLHSPKIEQLEIAARGDVRRAKLYYLRDRVGKAARVAERRWGIADEVLDTEEVGAIDAEGDESGRGRGRGQPTLEGEGDASAEEGPRPPIRSRPPRPPRPRQLSPRRTAATASPSRPAPPRSGPLLKPSADSRREEAEAAEARLGGRAGGRIRAGIPPRTRRPSRAAEGRRAPDPAPEDPPPAPSSSWSRSSPSRSAWRC